MTVNFFVQARLGSSRFPGKCLEPVLDDVTLLGSIDRRIRRSRHYRAGSVVYLTSTSPADDPLAQYFESQGWAFLRGSEEDVFSRFRTACDRYQPGLFVRICGDNPLLDPGFIDTLIDTAGEQLSDYTSFCDDHGTPVILTHYGFFAEVISTGSFLSIDPQEMNSAAREHVTPPFYAPGTRFASHLLPIPAELVDPGMRLTVDTPRDLDIVRFVFDQGGLDVSVEETYRIVRGAPDITADMRAGIEFNEKA
jgi:spore coat polysaccharide biosynthesis protein SpsF